MDDNKSKDSLSMKELGELAKKNRFEVFFCLIFLIACLFGIVGYVKPGWSLFSTVVGSILGILFPFKMDLVIKSTFHFIFKQEKTVFIVLGVGILVLSIFVPFLIFAFLGIIGGRTLHQMAVNFSPRS